MSENLKPENAALIERHLCAPIEKTTLREYAETIDRLLDAAREEGCAQQAREPKPVALQFIENWFAPWGSWKTSWWEWEVSDDVEMTDANALKHLRKLLAHPPKADPDVVRLVEALRLARRYAGVAIASATGRSSASAEEQLHNDLASIDAALAPFSALGEG